MEDEKQFEIEMTSEKQLPRTATPTLSLHEQEEEEEEVEDASSEYDFEDKKPTLIQITEKFKSMPRGARYWTYILLGEIALFIPVIVDISLFVLPESKSKGFFYYESTVNIAGNPMMYFFLYLATLWVILLFSQLTLLVLPGYILHIVRYFVGRKRAEIVRTSLEYIVSLNVFLSYLITMVVASALWGIYFTNTFNTFIVQNTLSCLTVASVFLLLEKFILQYIAVHFHEKSYRDRMVENKFTEFVVETMFEACKRKSIIKKKSKFSFINTIMQVTGVQAVYQLTTSVIKDFSSTIITGTTGLTDLQSTNQAIKLSKYLFEGLSKDGSELKLQDFKSIFGGDAKRAFNLFDINRNGDISFDELKAGCLKYYHEKRSIDRGLRDLGTSVAKLDQLLLTITLILLLLVCLHIFGVSVTAYLVTTGTMLLTVSFIIGSTLKNVCESIVFIFISHPYDVGDRIIVDGTLYLVRNMSILNTILVSSGKEITYPNSVLAMKFITNLRRSSHQTEQLEIFLPLETPNAKLQALETSLNQFAERNARHFHPKVSVSVSLIVDPDFHEKLKVEVGFTHKSNFHDRETYSMRHNKSVLALKDALMDVQLNASFSV